LAIGKYEKVSEIIKLANKLKDKTTAQALVLLDQYPRIEVSDSSLHVREVFNPRTHQKFNALIKLEGCCMERPEVSVLEGVLFGYKNCCIKYYVETRYFGFLRDKISENIGDEKDSINPCVLCPQCVKKL